MASFDRQSRNKLVKNIRYVNRLSRYSTPQRPRYPLGAGASIGQVAKVKTTITARSGSTAGQGTVTFENIDPSTGALTAGQDDVTVYNVFGASLSVGTYVTLMRSANGAWTVFDADCP